MPEMVEINGDLLDALVTLLEIALLPDYPLPQIQHRGEPATIVPTNWMESIKRSSQAAKALL